MINETILRQLNSKEMMVHDFVTRNCEKVGYMTIRQLAKEAHVSTTIVLNYIRKAGYEGYNDFKFQLKKQQKKEDAFFHSKYDFEEIIDCLKKFSSTFYKDKFEEASSIIKQGQTIVFIGVGNSGITAQYGSRRFTEMGKFSTALYDPYVLINDLPRQSVVIVISASGETEQIINKINDCKKSDCKIIAVTRSENTTIARMSDMTIPFYIDYRKDDSRSFYIDISSQIPIIAIIEMLAAMC